MSLPGHIHFVSPGQINVQIPWEFQGQTSVGMKVTLVWLSLGRPLHCAVGHLLAGYIRRYQMPRARDRRRQPGQTRRSDRDLRQRPGSRRYAAILGRSGFFAQLVENPVPTHRDPRRNPGAVEFSGLAPGLSAYTR